jgi:glycosyltransferase involved in cell wall biosynthesis
MKIGIVTSKSMSDSLIRIMRTTASVLRGRHTIIPYQPDFAHDSEQAYHDWLTQWLTDCDVIIGSTESTVPQVRSAIAGRVPYVCFLLGTLSRGGWNFAKSYQHLRTSDALVGNCSADIALCNKLFVDARSRLVPFAVDESTFYPIDEATKLQARKRAGFSPDDPIVIYAGRITVEKNVHTVLKAFALVQRAVPTCTLIIAGGETNAPFDGYGVYPINIKRTVKQIAERLGLTDRQVQFCGPLTTDDLRTLYNVADVAVNLTLHHDENFGLAQIEAMACGTPVVGSAWGGLIDTISDGVTGVKVSTRLTATGAKVNWWDAANKIVALLRDRAGRAAMREQCPQVVHERNSLERYRECLESVLADVAGREPGAPIRPSAFAQEFWRVCHPDVGSRPPPFRRGPEAAELYRQLMTQFVGPDPQPSADRNGHDILCLPSALELDGGRTIRVNDPIYPVRVEVPAGLTATVHDIARLMTREPVISVERAMAGLPGDETRFTDALTWMVHQGLVMRTPGGGHVIDARAVDAALGQPLVSISDVDHAADVVSIA